MPNEVIQLHRAKRPDDPRTDFELTELYAERFGDKLLNKYPGFAAEVAEIKEARRKMGRPGKFGELKRGFASGVDQFQAKLGDTMALVGQKTGSEFLKRKGAEIRDRNLAEASANDPSVPTVEDIQDIDDFSQWLAGLVGSQTPQFASTIGGATVGALLTGGNPAGIIAGGAAASFTQIQNYGELIEQGVPEEEAANIASAVGIAGGIVEALIPLKVTSSILGKVPNSIAKKYIARATINVPVNAIGEGGTEVAQEIIAVAGELYAQRDNPNFVIDDRAIQSRIINAAAAGTILGGITGVLESPAAKSQVEDTVKDRDDNKAANLVATEEKLTEKVHESPVAKQFIGKVDANTAAALSSLAIKDKAGFLTREDSLYLDSLPPEQKNFYSLAKGKVWEKQVARYNQVVEAQKSFQKQLQQSREQTTRLLPEGRGEPQTVLTQPQTVLTQPQQPSSLDRATQAFLRSQQPDPLLDAVRRGEIARRQAAEREGTGRVVEEAEATTTPEPAVEVAGEVTPEAQPVTGAVIQEGEELGARLLTELALDLENANIESGVKTTGAATTRTEPSFFRVEPGGENIGRRFTADGRVGKERRSITRRIGFFLTPDGRVIGAPVYPDHNHNEEARVGKNPVTPDSTVLFDKFVEENNLTPLASLLRPKSSPLDAQVNEGIVFPSLRKFEEVFGREADEMVGSAASGAVEEETQGSGATFNRKKIANEGSGFESGRVVPTEGPRGEEAELQDIARDILGDRFGEELGIGDVRELLENFIASDSDNLLAAIRYFRETIAPELAREESFNNATEQEQYDLFWKAAATSLMEANQRVGRRSPPASQETTTKVDRPTEDTGQGVSEASQAGPAAPSAELSDIEKLARKIASRASQLTQEELALLNRSGAQVRARVDEIRQQTGVTHPQPVMSSMLDKLVLRRPDPNSEYRPNKRVQAETYLSVLHAIARAGGDISLFQTDLDAMADEFFATEGGAVATRGDARSSVVLVANDILNPTEGNLRDALHEAAHFLFGSLPLETRQALVDAINKLGDVELRITQSEDPRIKQANPNGLRNIAEERLVESMAITTGEPEARNIARRFLNFIQEVYLRAMLVVQKMLGQAPNPNTVYKWFGLRFSRFLQGGYSRGLVSYLGGGRHSFAQKAAYYTPAYGGKWNSHFYDAETGQWLAKENAPFTSEEFVYWLENMHTSVKYSRPKDRPLGYHISEDVANEAHDMPVAVNNSVLSTLGEAFTAFNVSGEEDFRDFLSDATPEATDRPDLMLAAIKEAVEARNLKFNESSTLETINPNLRKPAYRNLLLYAKRMLSSLGLKRQKAESSIEKAENDIKRNNERIAKLVAKRQDADALVSDILSSFNEEMENFRKDLRTFDRDTGANSSILQELRRIDDEIDHDIAKRYESVLDKLIRRISGDKRASFFDMVEDIIAHDDNYFLRPVNEIVEDITRRAKAVDILGPVSGDSADSRALAAIIGQFVKSDVFAVELLKTRRERLGKERAEYEAAIKTALSEADGSIERAMGMARKLKSSASSAGKIIQKISKLRETNRNRRHGIERDRRRVRIADSVIPEMQRVQLDAERELSAQAKISGPKGKRVVTVQGDFEGIEGENYVVPSLDGRIKKVREYHSIEEKVGSELTRDLQEMDAWLDEMDKQGTANPLFGGTTYQRVKSQAQVIRDQWGAKTQFSRSSLGMFKWLRGIGEKLASIGLPMTDKIVAGIRKYAAFDAAIRRPMQRDINRWENAEARAMSALGYKAGHNVEHFRAMVYDRALNLISLNKESIRSSTSTPQEAQLKALRLVKNKFLNDPQTAEAMSKPGAWEALENYLNITAEVSANAVNYAKFHGIKVNDEDADVLREVVGIPLLEVMRMPSQSLVHLHNRMKSKWLSAEFKGLEQTYDQDPDQVRQALAPLFDEYTTKNFVEEIIYREGKSSFQRPAGKSLLRPLYSREEVIAAWEASNKDVVTFAETLYRLGLDEKDTTQSAGNYVADTIETFREFFGVINSLVPDNNNSAPLLATDGTKQILMWGRKAEDFPSSWVRHRPYDWQNVLSVYASLTQHAAFGRNLQVIHSNIAKAKEALGKIASAAAVVRLNPEAGKKEVEEIAREYGVSTQELDKASRKLAEIENIEKDINAWLKSHSGTDIELKTFQHLIGTAGLGAVQGAMTALTDTSSLLQPFLTYGLSKQAFMESSQNLKFLAKNFSKSIASTFSSKVRNDHDTQRILEAVGAIEADYDVALTEKWNAVKQSSPRFDGQSIPEGTSAALRRLSLYLRSIMSTGVGKARDKTVQKTRFHAPFIWLSTLTHVSAIEGTVDAYQRLVGKAVQVLQKGENVKEINNPNFKFKASDLGYKNGLFGFLRNKDAFEKQVALLEERGMTLESLARDYIRRADLDTNGKPRKKASIFSETALQRIAGIAVEEIMLESTAANTPAGYWSSPLLQLAMPLLSWSTQRTKSVAKAFNKADGTTDLLNFRRWVGTMSAIIGTGILYSLLRDEYEEKVLGKKGNILDLSGPNAPLALIDRMGRVGTFGLAGEAVNGIFNQDTARPFSVDSRVLFVNSMLSVMQALGNFYRQDTATYSTVVRPLAAAIGASGYLQNGQVINHLMVTKLGADPLFEREYRVVARTNANNYLRSAGRALNMDVRLGRSASVVSNPVRPWVTEMVLSALANDGAAFREAHKQAIKASENMGNEDPAGHIKRSFQSYHPLKAVFKTAPSEAEYQAILRELPEDGRRDVREAVSLVNRYGQTIGVTPFLGVTRRNVKRTNPFLAR